MAGGAGAWTRAATFASADEIFISGLSAAEIGADVSFCAKGDAGCTGAFGGMEGGVCAGIWGLVCAGVDAPAAGPLGRPASDGIDEAEVMSLAATAGVVTGTSAFRTMGSGSEVLALAQDAGPPQPLAAPAHGLQPPASQLQKRSLARQRPECAAPVFPFRVSVPPACG